MNSNITYLSKPIILTSLPFGVMGFLLTIYSKNLDMSALEIAGLYSVLSFILIIMRPILGKISDTCGRKPIFLFSCLVFAISHCIYAVASTMTLIYVARILQGVATASMTISTYAIISDTTDKTNSSEAFGKIDGYHSSGYFYGCMLTFFVFSCASFMESWKILFAIFSIASLYALLNSIKKVPETQNFAAQKSILSKKNKLKNLSKDTIKVLFIIFIVAIGSSIVSSIIMIYLIDKFSNDMMLIAIAYLPSLIAQSMFAAKIGNYADKSSKKKSMILGLLIIAITSIATPSANSFILLCILWVISTMGGILYGVCVKSIYTDVTNDSQMGVMYSIYSIVCDFGLVIGPLIGGFVYDSVSMTTPFYISGGIMIVVCLIIAMIIKETNSNHQSSIK